MKSKTRAVAHCLRRGMALNAGAIARLCNSRATTHLFLAGLLGLQVLITGMRGLISSARVGAPMKPLQSALAGSAVVVMAGLVSGCATTGANPEDPYEDFNRQMYAFNDGFDKAVFEPAAKGYRAVTNKPVRQGVSNFINNLEEP